MSSQPKQMKEPSVRQPDVFEAYELFMSLPKLLRYPPKDKSTGTRMEPRDYAISFGIEDDVVLDLLALRTQKNFAKRYGITQQTLGRWNGLVDERHSFEYWRKWAEPLSSNVLFMLYKRIVEEKGQPEHFKLWLSMVLGWSDKNNEAVAPRSPQTLTVKIIDSTVGEAASSIQQNQPNKKV